MEKLRSVEVLHHRFNFGDCSLELLWKELTLLAVWMAVSLRLSICRPIPLSTPFCITITSTTSSA